MISTELSAVRAKEPDRNALAKAMAEFERSGRSIEVVAGFESVSRPVSWQNDGFALPGSSTNSKDKNKDAALAKQIREQVAKGCGISSMVMNLSTSAGRIKRVAFENKIDIRKALAAGTIGVKARQACQVSGALRRAKLAEQIRPLAAKGWTIKAMAEHCSACARTIMRTLDEFSIPRADKYPPHDSPEGNPE